MSATNEERLASVEATHEAENIDARVTKLEEHIAVLNREMGALDAKMSIVVALTLGTFLAVAAGVVKLVFGV